MKNRIYKFRAYSNKFKDLQSAYFDEDGWFVLGDGKVSVNEEDVMQFTGLKDKNGKDIFEGDLVKEADGEIRTIIWENGSFFRKECMVGHIKTLYQPGTEECEVIGNIFEKAKELQDDRGDDSGKYESDYCKDCV